MFYAHAVNFLSVIWFLSRIWRTNRDFALVNVCLLTILLEIVTAKCWPIFSLTVPAWSILCVLAWRKWSLSHLERASGQALRQILDETVLEMRTGKSFRPALTQAIRCQPSSRPAELIELWLQAKSLGRAAPAGPQWWRPVALELGYLDLQAHQAVTRLLAWRSRLKLESDFRRRCGQVTAQVRLQVFVLTGIYFAIFAFSSRAGVLVKQPVLCALSFSMFVIGVGLILRRGGRVRWNF